MRSGALSFPVTSERTCGDHGCRTTWDVGSHDDKKTIGDCPAPPGEGIFLWFRPHELRRLAHQPGDFRFERAALPFEPGDHPAAVGLAAVLAQLPLALQPGDGQAEADDSLELCLDVVRR